MDIIEILYKVAEATVCMMKWRHCEKTYRMIIDMKGNVEEAGVWHGYAICLEELGKREESREAYRIALELHLRNLRGRESYLWGGWAAFKLGEYELACKLFEEAVKEDPSYAYSWLSLSMASRKCNREERAKEAMESYRKAIKEKPYKRRECEGKEMLLEAYKESDGWVKDYIEDILKDISNDKALESC
ncbi:MAG: tetratricopeptide repeat protein [Caldisphaeraceae archaeon]|nr:tetratricopeptide repeat protein [Caldisphaeraceae archaeon]